MIDPAHGAALLMVAAGATALLIWALHPWLVRYALARPNARSSHTTPTPQGGGIAIVVSVATVMVASAYFGLPGFREPWVGSLLLAIATLALMGAVDDIRPLPVMPRLILHFAVATLLVLTLPIRGQVLPFLPMAVESALLVVGLVWFTNLTNFMDGIDLLTVVEMVPISACLAVLGLFKLVPEMTVLLPLSLALLGGMLGFAPYNRHVARLFLGDVGSLPIGALAGWLLIILALSGHAVAALILPLYYLADATITLVRRHLNGEQISQPHRSHFYQRAVDGGFTVPAVTRAVLMLNMVLAGLAVLSIVQPSAPSQVFCLVAAIAATLFLLRRFENGMRA